ncbi:FliH/SctL family protein [uncultured Robinsoniella sp.]|uniref:FliH/SctL family protein n=1 Tax=uncultured Robinsoniella sp. TaxID=904190 RepID=UPI00374EBC57
MTFLYRIIKSEDTILEDGKIELYKREEQDLPEEITIVNGQAEDNQAEQEEALEDMLVEATKRAEKSVAKILEDAYAKRDTIVNTAIEESKRLKKQAVEEGKEEGVRRMEEKVGDSLKAINKALEALQKQVIENNSSLQKSIVEMSLEIASRIMSKRIQEDETQMTELVKTAVLAEKDKRQINIILSEEMTKLIDKLEWELDPLRERIPGNIRIKTSVMEKDGCRIETEEGIMDVSVSVQLDNLRRQLQKLESD